MQKWQISKPKIVDWYLDFTKESYVMLKSVTFFSNLFSKLWATENKIFEAQKYK